MAKLAESAQGNMLFEDGSIAINHDESLSQEEQSQEFKRVQRDLIQMYVDSALGKGGSGIKDVENYLYRIAPGFSHIAIETDFDGVPYYRAMWKDDKKAK